MDWILKIKSQLELQSVAFETAGLWGEGVLCNVCMLHGKRFGYSTVLQQSKHMDVRLAGDSKAAIGGHHRDNTLQHTIVVYCSVSLVLLMHHPK